MDKNYLLLNNKVNMKDKEGNYINLNLEEKSVRDYFLNNINQNMIFFHNLEEKIQYLVENKYYDEKVINRYSLEQIKNIFKIAYNKKIRFKSFVGAFTFYERYALRTTDKTRILERYEDRLSMIALTIATSYDEAVDFIHVLADRVLQGSTPVFLNAGKLKGGDLVSCYLLSMEDNLESISYVINSSMQMSKRGGGVGISLDKIRARGETIKGVEDMASGVLPPSKVFEDTFSYINQLGTRNGAGVVYLNIFHNDIEEFINSKKVNSDEKLRLKTLSTGVIIPDKFMEILSNKDKKYFYTFYPKNVFDVYGVELVDMDMNEMYDKLIENKHIKKTQRNKINVVQEILRTTKESGFPYILFIDNANKQHALKDIGKITMSNLCTEIFQVNTKNKFDENIYSNKNEYGYDISCVLSSLNLVNLFTNYDENTRRHAIETSIKFLSNVSDLSDLKSVPSIQKANSELHSIGLGVMGLHTLFVKLNIEYESEEALDLTNIIFSYLKYFSLKSSMEISKFKGSFKDFNKSEYGKGVALNEYINEDILPKTDYVKKILKDLGVSIPTKDNWKELNDNIVKHGLYNAYHLTQAPNQSSAYIMEVSGSIQPVSNAVEIRDYGYLQAIYPMPLLTNENKHLYKSAYDIDQKKYLNLVAQAQKHVCQGISTTLFIDSETSLKEQLSLIIHAHKLGLKSLYYWRVRKNSIMADKEPIICESCSV